MMNIKCWVLVWLVLFIQTGNAATGAGFFGMHETNAKVHGWPSVPFQTYRTWDVYPNVTWQDINTSSGAYSWTTLDALVSLAQSHGVDIVYTLGKTPSWASSNPTGSCGNNSAGSCYSPTNMSDWTTFITAITARYAGKIKYWELWNEPNASNFWAGTTAELEAMGAAAYPIIKASNAAATVLTPAPQGTSAYNWMNGYLTAGGGPYADIVSFHGYVGTVPESIVTLINNMKTVMTNQGVSSKPLWDTEHSWGADANFSNADQQAAWVARHSILAWSNGLAVSIWYSWDNDLYGTLWNKTTSVITKAGTAYGQVNNWLVGSTLTTACSMASDSTWTCLLNNSAGQQNEIIWNAATTSAQTVPNIYTAFRDLDGATTAIANHTVTVSFKPLLLTSTATSNGTLTATPATLTFAPQVQGTTSPAQTVTITNTGTTSITLGSISITGTNAGDFAIASNNCPATLAVSAVCTVGVTFKPTATGTRTASLTIPDNTPTGPHTVSLTGDTLTAPSAPTGLTGTVN